VPRTHPEDFGYYIRPSSAELRSPHTRRTEEVLYIGRRGAYMLARYKRKKKIKDRVDQKFPRLLWLLITMSEQSYALFCMGNPLLDIQVTNGEQLLKKYNLNPNDAILADEKQLPMWDILSPILRTLLTLILFLQKKL
jgi:hypothetical protein